MKKLLLISLIFILAFSFAISSLAEKKIELLYWTCPFFQAEGKEQGFYERKLADEFEELYPNVKIEILIVPWAQNIEKMEIAIASDTMPDIFFHSNDGLWNKVNRGLCLSFDEVCPEWEKERYFDFLKDTGFRDGKIMVLPFSSSAAPGMAINVDLAKKAGAYELLPLDDPYRRWNHEECLAFFRKCKVLTEEGIYPYCIPAGSNTGDMSTRQLMVNFGMKVFNKEGNKLIMNSPEGVKALEWIVNLNDEGLLYPNPETTRGEDYVDLFFSGKLVSWYGAAGVYTTSEKWLSKVPNQVYVQYPTIDGTDPKCSAGMGGFVVFDNGDPIKAKYAKLFCKYFVTYGDPADVGGFSPYKDVEVVTDNENLGLMARSGIFAGDYFGDSLPYYPMLRESFYPELQAAFLHIKTPQEALDDLCTIVNELIEQ